MKTLLSAQAKNRTALATSSILGDAEFAGLLGDLFLDERGPYEAGAYDIRRDVVLRALAEGHPPLVRHSAAASARNNER